MHMVSEKMCASECCDRHDTLIITMRALPEEDKKTLIFLLSTEKRFLF